VVRRKKQGRPEWQRRIARVAGAGFAIACVSGAVTWATTGCSGWDPTSPFERNAPAVDDAIRDIDAGRLESAEATLEEYLGTGPCGDAGIGLPDSVRQKPNGSFDLGLTLFYMAEKYGKRFGEEEPPGEGAEEEKLAEMRGVEIDCALVIVKAIAADPSVPLELRARARYLAGNLEFLRRRYEKAVEYYDQALQLIPGLFEEAGGDGIGRDAAWNRAIALRRIQDQKDAGPDSPDGDDGNDGADAPDSEDAPDGQDAPDGNDAPDGDDGNDGSDGAEPDAGQDGGDKDSGKGDADTESDAGGDAKPDEQGQDGSSPQPDPEGQKQPATPNMQQDERMLDRLEEAPTYQEQEAKSRAGMRRGRGMEDK
jgi:tetratricopeptide (TPR) repeat protein